MEKIKNYDVSFFGLKDGNHTFKYSVTQAFFDLFTFEQEFSKPEIHIDVNLEKKVTFLELTLDMKGTIDLVGDITNIVYQQPIEGHLTLVVNFGQEFDDSDDQVWVIPHGENRINIAQLIYELVILNIPTKHIHPDLSSEEASEAVDLLDKYSPKSIEEIEEDKSGESEELKDPRWDTLKKLL